MINACNNFVFIKRKETAKESAGLIIPNQGREKPNEGEIISVGDLAGDKKIKNGKGKIAVFHRGIGFSIEVDGEEYLVLTDNEIIGIK